MPSPPAGPRSAAEINADMRALWDGGVLADVEATQRDMAEAA